MITCNIALHNVYVQFGKFCFSFLELVNKVLFDNARGQMNNKRIRKIRYSMENINDGI